MIEDYGFGKKDKARRKDSSDSQSEEKDELLEMVGDLPSMNRTIPTNPKQKMFSMLRSNTLSARVRGNSNQVLKPGFKKLGTLPLR